MNIKKQLFLIDGYILIFRAYYAFIKNPRINSQELNTSVIFGFLQSLIKIIKNEKPTHLAICFDVKGKTFRHKLYTNYKSNRKKTPESIRISIPYIKNIINAMKISFLEMSGYESDDLIGTLAKKAEKKNFKIFIVTLDKDFGQLVSKNIMIYQLANKKNQKKILGIEEIKNKFQVKNPIQIIDLLGMMGDIIDNIPGLPGIGKKTAIKFIKEYGSLENLFNNINKIKGKIRYKIENKKDIGFLSKKLATINTNVPIKFDDKDLLLKEPDWNEIYSLFKELEFSNLYDKIYNIYLKFNMISLD